MRRILLLLVLLICFGLVGAVNDLKSTKELPCSVTLVTKKRETRYVVVMFTEEEWKKAYWDLKQAGWTEWRHYEVDLGWLWRGKVEKWIEECRRGEK